MTSRSPRAVVAETLAVVAAAAALARAGGSYASGAIALLFLGVCAWRSWRLDDARVQADGLALGGLAAPVPEPRSSFVRSAAHLAGVVAIVFPPFVVAWVAVLRPAVSFDARAAFAHLEPLAEIVIVALPEEAFFRGYVQSRLAEAWPGRVGLVSHANLVASALFALGHFGTSVSVARASVFFPSLLFGLLRERTGGVVVPVLFHALCNVLSRVLFQGFGLA